MTPLAETVEQEVETAEARHAFRMLFSGMKLGGVTNAKEQSQLWYDLEQNSLRTLHRDLSIIARRYGFDPANGEYVNAFDVAEK